LEHPHRVLNQVDQPRKEARVMACTSLLTGAPDADGPRIAIVGGAAAGIAMVYHLSLHPKPYAGVRITIFDKHPEPWGGSAHSDQSSALRVNMRPELHDLPGFVTFHEACGLFGWRGDELPLRKLLGGYLQLAFVTARTRLELNGARVQIVNAEVMAIARVGWEYLLYTGDDRKMPFDFVVLALGNAPPTPPKSLFARKERGNAAA
jgi:uncharacterized NAD(P)/FAD-binding protein YdhS